MSKIKLNTNSGGSLTLEVKPTLATDEVIEIDAGFGITSGVSGDISWTKLPDGTMLMYGVDSYSSSLSVSNRFGTTSGTAYYNSSEDVVFPVSFLSGTIPTVTMNGSPNSIHIRTGLPTNTGFSWIEWTQTDQTSGATVSWQAIGRWK